jgi:hypothetical protein
MASASLCPTSRRRPVSSPSPRPAGRQLASARLRLLAAEESFALPLSVGAMLEPGRLLVSSQSERTPARQPDQADERCLYADTVSCYGGD